MASLLSMVVGLEVCLLPLLGITMMVTGKVAVGRLALAAEKMFFGTLLLATVATFRTLLAGETLWLMHAVTMAVMIVGSVSIPGNNRSEAATSYL